MTETLRGRGPAPPGYRVCFDDTCPGRRDPTTGRFGPIPNHFHPVPAQPVRTLVYRCRRCGHTAYFAPMSIGPVCGSCLSNGQIENMRAVEIAQ